jgi:hypothetical protein
LGGYDPKTGRFWWRVTLSNRAVAGTVAGAFDSKGYRNVMIDGRNYKASRLAWAIMTGEWPPETIDHRDGNPRNDRWDNLRLATYSQNNTNRRNARNNTTGLKGARPHKITGRYQARIFVNGQHCHLGYFTHAEEAHHAYREAAREHHGEFAYTGDDAAWDRRWRWFICSRIWIEP